MTAVILILACLHKLESLQRLQRLGEKVRLGAEGHCSGINVNLRKGGAGSSTGPTHSRTKTVIDCANRHRRWALMQMSKITLAIDGKTSACTKYRTAKLATGRYIGDGGPFESRHRLTGVRPGSQGHMELTLAHFNRSHVLTGEGVVHLSRMRSSGRWAGGSHSLAVIWH